MNPSIFSCVVCRGVASFGGTNGRPDEPIAVYGLDRRELSPIIVGEFTFIEYS